jgi:hypothetical protein
MKVVCQFSGISTFERREKFVFSGDELTGSEKTTRGWLIYRESSEYRSLLRCTPYICLYTIAIILKY